MENKTCSKCKQDKAISDFYLRTGKKLYHSACRQCEREMAKQWYEQNRDKAIRKYRAWRENNPEAVKKYRTTNRQKHYRQEVVRKYGVTPEWFDQQIKKQGNACMVCKRPFAWGDKQTSPHVDHCHNSKVVRGILCNRCNSVLGLCEDNGNILSLLARYLRRWHGR